MKKLKQRPVWIVQIIYRGRWCPICEFYVKREEGLSFLKSFKENNIAKCRLKKYLPKED